MNEIIIITIPSLKCLTFCVDDSSFVIEVINLVQKTENLALRFSYTAEYLYLSCDKIWRDCKTLTIDHSFLIRMLLNYVIVTSVVIGLPCNLYCFLFYIRRRKDLANVFLAYMNIADAIHCLSNMVGIAIFSQMLMNISTLSNMEIKMVATTTTTHVTRSSITVTGVITIYLNILRTSAIIWPMMRFNKKRLHVSFLVVLVCFVVFEIAIGVLYTYPDMRHFFKTQDKSTGPFSVDHPLRKMYTLSDIIITDYIVTDTNFQGHNYSRSTVSVKFFIFRTVKTNFHLKE